MNKRSLAFRLDDITPGLHRSNIKRIEEIFDSYGIKPMLGIVPFNEDPHLVVDDKDDDFWTQMRRLSDKGWTIALHGYRHVYGNDNSGILEANPFSEFAGISYDEQVKMISEGKDLLAKQGLVPAYFMAPGHTFDLNTLKALAANGIFRITDGYADRPYIREGITFYPCTLSDPCIPRGADTVCIHLNNWKETDFNDLESFLKEHKDICVDFDTWSKDLRPEEYDRTIAAQEERYRKRRLRRQNMAENERMQAYLRKSYSDNRYVKIMKRILFMPMLLKR